MKLVGRRVMREGVMVDHEGPVCCGMSEADALNAKAGDITSGLS